MGEGDDGEGDRRGIYSSLSMWTLVASLCATQYSMALKVHKWSVSVKVSSVAVYHCQVPVSEGTHGLPGQAGPL